MKESLSKKIVAGLFFAFSIGLYIGASVSDIYVTANDSTTYFFTVGVIMFVFFLLGFLLFQRFFNGALILSTLFLKLFYLLTGRKTKTEAISYELNSQRSTWLILYLFLLLIVSFVVGLTNLNLAIALFLTGFFLLLFLIK